VKQLLSKVIITPGNVKEDIPLQVNSKCDPVVTGNGPVLITISLRSGIANVRQQFFFREVDGWGSYSLQSKSSVMSYGRHGYFLQLQ